MAEEENTDYESDTEEVKMSLKMRRREGSDDEQEEDGDEVDDRESNDGESDGQGAADDYDGENDFEEEDEEYYSEGEYSEVEEREISGGTMEEKEKDIIEAKAEDKGEGDGDGDGEGAEKVEEKKEVEPFSVPTSGAFYMHDDRFRDIADGRNRRTFDGRKLWESKDERKWGHDKFEELNMQHRRYEEGKRPSKGPYRGRGKARGTSSGYGRGNRGRGFSGNSNQNAPPKDMRGRGPRRYQPLMKNKGETHPPEYKQSVRSFDKSSRTGSGRMAPSTGSSNAEHQAAPSKKVGSNLSSASPPFYPSLGASAEDIASTQKKEMHTGYHNRNIRPSGDPTFPTPVSNPSSRGKNVNNSMGIDKLHIDDAVSPASSKAINNVHSRSSTSSSSSPNQLAHPRGQGRVVAPSRPAVFQPSQTNNQVNKVSLQASQANQQSPVQTQGQLPLQAPGQQLALRPLVASQSSSPSKAGKGAVQGTGRGSLVYGGAQVMGSGGNVGAGHGDPNMPAFFPVMQFDGQHPGGMGVPAVGMAFPGYVAQPNGLGNSEMTWLPMLASAAGALGASYCPPYLAVDGNYHPRPTVQTPALPAPSKDNNLNKTNNEIKPQQRFEVANDEFSHRQNKPRRYSEMNFSQ